MYSGFVNLKRKVSPWVYSEEIQLSEQFAYGHREVLLASNKLDPSGLFLASIPHGWGPDVPGRPYPKVFKRSLSEYPILAWSSRTSADLKARGYKFPIPTGSPWAHLLSSLGLNSIKESSSSKATDSNSSLYFPSHSIPGGEHYHNFNLKRVLSDISPTNLTVCLFWLDFINPRVRNYYSQFNCELVCVGYKGSTGFDIPWAPVGGREMFLPNLLELMERHDTIILETVSTPFWYATSLKKNIYLADLSVTATWWGESKSIDLSINNRELLELVDAELGKIGMNELIPTTDLLYERAKSELGFEHVDMFLNNVVEFKLIKANAIPASIADPLTDYINLRKNSSS